MQSVKCLRESIFGIRNSLAGSFGRLRQRVDFFQAASSDEGSPNRRGLVFPGVQVSVTVLAPLAQDCLDAGLSRERGGAGTAIYQAS